MDWQGSGAALVTWLHSSAHKFIQVFKAVWGWLNDMLSVIDTHSASITALATVAIVILTVFYVSYSKGQWETMQTQAAILQRQLKDSEASTSAQLIVEDFNPTLTMGEPGQGMFIRGSFTVTNVGNSVASEIYFVKTIRGITYTAAANATAQADPRSEWPIS